MVEEKYVNVWVVPVPALKALWNPMRDNVWGCGIIAPDDVLSCPDVELGEIPAQDSGGGSKQFNVARIAWLMKHGWDEKKDPITLEVWPETLSDWPVLLDGNHRFSALILMNAPYVELVVNGDLQWLEEYLIPVRKKEVLHELQSTSLNA